MRKYLCFALVLFPALLMAQYKVSGFVTQLNLMTAVKYIPVGHKLSLIVKDSFNVKAISDLREFDKQYTETKEDRRTHRYIKRLKKEFKKDQKIIEEQKRVESASYIAYIHALSHPVQSEIIDQNGKYVFENIPNGEYVLILDVGGSGLPLEPRWKYDNVKVNNKDLNFNFESGHY